MSIRRTDCRTCQEHLSPRGPAGPRRGLDTLPHGSPEGVVGVRRSRCGVRVSIIGNDDADADAASAIMDEADAAAEEFATVLAEKLEADIPPIAEFDAPEDPQGGVIACRIVGPRSPCK